MWRTIAKYHFLIYLTRIIKEIRKGEPDVFSPAEWVNAPKPNRLGFIKMDLGNQRIFRERDCLGKPAPVYLRTVPAHEENLTRP
jgi:hypothetical protein